MICVRRANRSTSPSGVIAFGRPYEFLRSSSGRAQSHVMEANRLVYTLPVTPVLNSKIRADEFKNIQIAITLIRSGQTEKARSVLVALCRRNNDCEAGWLWLAQAAQTSKQRSACLKQVLRINPDNHHARKWLEQAQPEAPPAQESPAFVSTEPDSAPPQLEVRTEPELEPVPRLLKPRLFWTRATKRKLHSQSPRPRRMPRSAWNPNPSRLSPLPQSSKSPIRFPRPDLYLPNRSSSTRRRQLLRTRG